MDHTLKVQMQNTGCSITRHLPKHLLWQVFSLWTHQQIFHTSVLRKWRHQAKVGRFCTHSNQANDIGMIGQQVHHLGLSTELFQEAVAIVLVHLFDTKTFDCDGSATPEATIHHAERTVADRFCLQEEFFVVDLAQIFQSSDSSGLNVRHGHLSFVDLGCSSRWWRRRSRRTRVLLLPNRCRKAQTKLLGGSKVLVRIVGIKLKTDIVNTALCHFACVEGGFGSTNSFYPLTKNVLAWMSDNIRYTLNIPRWVKVIWVNNSTSNTSTFPSAIASFIDAFDHRKLTTLTELGSLWCALVTFPRCQSIRLGNNDPRSIHVVVSGMLKHIAVDLRVQVLDGIVLRVFTVELLATQRLGR
mmetsp:Transcript_907/g.2847  ORF Transcript_907/g.2847 Transcript_907/m.2847 type:complete len:356 (+) Transcript_907:1038-2105(+)